MKIFANSELVYGQPIKVVMRFDGNDGMVGDAPGVYMPGDEVDGVTYDMAFDSLSENGYIEVE